MSINFVKTSSGVVAAATPADGTFVWASDTKKFYRGDGATLGGNLIGPGAATGTVGGPSVTVANQIAIFSGTNGNLTSAANTGIITATAGVIGSVGTLSVSQGGTGLGLAASNSVLVATATNAISALTLTPSTVVGMRASGGLVAYTLANLKTDLTLDAVANVDQLPRAEAPVAITASTTLTSATHGGKVLMCNNTAAITLSITSGTAAQNMQCLAVMSNTSTVNIASLGGELINSSSATVASISARWKSAYIYKYASNASLVDAG